MHISDANDIQQRRGKGRTEREGERVREWEDKNEKKSRGRIDGEIGGLKVPVAETEATLLNPQTADDADDAAATF